MENTLTQCRQASTAQYQKKRGLRLTSGDFDCDILITLLGQEYSDGESGKPYFTQRAPLPIDSYSKLKLFI